MAFVILLAKLVNDIFPNDDIFPFGNPPTCTSWMLDVVHDLVQRVRLHVVDFECCMHDAVGLVIGVP